jgi:hypothetical protein
MHLQRANDKQKTNTGPDNAPGGKIPKVAGLLLQGNGRFPANILGCIRNSFGPCPSNAGKKKATVSGETVACEKEQRGNSAPCPLFMPIGAGALLALVLRNLATSFLS